MKTPPARVGRPPTVTSAEIAEAALAVGLDRATVRNVADHLGMSVPGLYHHVRTREELLAMAAAHSLGALELPAYHGQEWTEWLLDYARFVYDALVAQPEIIGQVLAGTVNTLRAAQHLEGFFEVLGVPAILGRTFTPDKLRQSATVVALSQSRLREQVEGLLTRMNSQLVQQDPAFAKIAELMPQAVAAMKEGPGNRLGSPRASAVTPTPCPRQRSFRQRSARCCRHRATASGASSVVVRLGSL